MQNGDEEKKVNKEKFEVSDSMKAEGWVYRKPDINDSKYKECEAFLKDSFTLNLRSIKWDKEDGKM